MHSVQYILEDMLTVHFMITVFNLIVLNSWFTFTNLSIPTFRCLPPLFLVSRKLRRENYNYYKLYIHGKYRIQQVILTTLRRRNTLKFTVGSRVRDVEHYGLHHHSSAVIEQCDAQYLTFVMHTFYKYWKIRNCVCVLTLASQ